MPTSRLPRNDPRTVARDIPGILDTLFPQLNPGVVAHFNRESYPADNCKPVPVELIEASSLQRAMLFEVAIAVAEQMLISDKPIDWDECLLVAVARQRRHFDAQLPEALSIADQTAAVYVATNLVSMLHQTKVADGGVLVHSPSIPGYQWIASGVGDFSVGKWLIEVKCSNRRFSSSDYRQILMYWLLGYAAAVENGAPEWTDCILLNPRLNEIVALPYDEIIRITGAGRSKVEMLELFSCMVSDHTFHTLASL